jgi:ribosome biogenesis GTPase A
MKIQWFPGHMAKAKKEIQKNVKLVDLIIEIVDARCPFSSTNYDIKNETKHKLKLVVVNKTDLIDEKNLDEFKKCNSESEILCISLKESKKVDKLIEDAALRACSEIFKKRKEKNIINSKIKAMVVGMPNVGKTTFINRYINKNVLQTANKPGVTRQVTWIKASQTLDLLDTPGISMPSFKNEQMAENLALIGSINDEIVNIDELVFSFINYCKVNYKEALVKRYKLSFNEDISMLDTITIYDQIATNMNCITNKKIDYTKCAKLILTDFRSGSLGKISLDESSFY